MTSNAWLRCLACVGLFAALPVNAAKTRVVVLGIASDPKMNALAESVSELVLTELQRDRALDVLGTSDIKTLLGAERQRQLLGCNEGSCTVEIAAALGAPWLVAGSLAQAGQTTRINLKLINAHDNKVVFRDGSSIKNQSEIFDVVAQLVPRL